MKTNKKYLLPAIAVVAVVIIAVVAMSFDQSEIEPEILVETTVEPQPEPEPVVVEEKPRVLPLAWFEFVDIQPGEFMMGCDSKTDKCQDDELPARSVGVAEGFSVSKFEVTQKAWQEIMGSNPSTFMGEARPVDTVSFNDVQLFIGKLNTLAEEELFRLPTEAEWEYIARAGQPANYPLATAEQTLVQSAWFGQLETTGTQAVGQLQPNAWGLHDISGNVMEWVQDCWQENYQEASPTVAAVQSTPCDSHALRGGSWIDKQAYVRLAYRNNWDKNYRSHEVGFRLVRRLINADTKTSL